MMGLWCCYVYLVYSPFCYYFVWLRKIWLLCHLFLIFLWVGADDGGRGCSWCELYVLYSVKKNVITN